MLCVVATSVPNGVSWYGPLVRPTPTSTLPSLNMSSVDARAATCSGWCTGASTTPNPSRIFLVCCAITASITSGADECANSVRK